MASLNSLRQFWRSAVRPPLVMTALVPWSWWKRRSLVVLAPPTEQGLPGDMAVGPSELSSERRRGNCYKLRRHEVRSVCVLQPLTDVVHDGGLCSLAVEVDHGVDAGRDVPGGRALSHAVYKEVQAAILFPYYANCVTCL